MNNPESLREFTNQLVRRGLPVDYARRAAEELADHHRDLIEEGVGVGLEQSVALAAATERLGPTKSLIKQSVRSYQRRHWSGRWRVMTFVFGPVPLLIATWFGTLLTLKFFGKVLKAIGYGTPNSSHDLSAFGLVLLYATIGWFLLVVPALLVVILSRWALRSGVDQGWLIASAILLAISAGSVQAGIVPSPETVEHPFFVSIPLGVPFRSISDLVSWYLHTPLQAAQLIVPPLTAAILVLRNAVRRHHSLLATGC